IQPPTIAHCFNLPPAQRLRLRSGEVAGIGDAQFLPYLPPVRRLERYEIAMPVDPFTREKLHPALQSRQRPLLPRQFPELRRPGPTAGEDRSVVGAEGRIDDLGPDRNQGDGLTCGGIPDPERARSSRNWRRSEQ